MSLPEIRKWGIWYTIYDKQLRQRFAEFKAEGVEEFILDLRYNGGGLVTSAQLLAELLAPKSALG